MRALTTLSGVCLAQKCADAKLPVAGTFTWLLPRTDAVALGRGNAG